VIIEPVTRGLLCATAHPEGCTRRVRTAIDTLRSRPTFSGPRKALIIGSSAGLGLATRAVAAFGSQAATIGVCLERPGTPQRCGSAGWYNTAALETEVSSAGLFGRTVIGDAFSDSVKLRTAKVIGEELGRVDLVVYSVAAPRRETPGEAYGSALKTIGAPFTAKSYNVSTGGLVLETMPAASLREIRNTVAVMGGDDWMRWMEALGESDVLAPDVTTVAFSYVGNRWLAPTYRDATIGKAKEHLEWTARCIDTSLRSAGGRAHAAVMRAMITQSSSVLSIQRLYAALLLRVSREMGLHETVLDQAYRLCADRLYGPPPLAVDEEGRIRLDDWEMAPDVQTEVRRRWEAVDTGTLDELSAMDEYRAEILALCGFGVPGVDYTQETDPVLNIPNVVIG
jgi:enoyl-[acyl-carrier protein] reductase/trans-2-enoyl-CoA reductase (NAD+)